MKLCSFREHDQLSAGILLGTELVDVRTVNRLLGTSFPNSVSELIRRYQLDDLRRSFSQHSDRLRGAGRDVASLTLTLPCSNPPKIWGIGLNFAEHASDLAERRPDEPASFMRPATTMIGPGEPVCLPADSKCVTGEAELAVVIGRRCKFVSREEAPSVIAGFLPAIDMTAEDILRRNPRFLTRAKSFDTFLSLGAFLVTPDEVGSAEELQTIRVSTRLNGEVKRSNILANMRHSVFDLVAYHSHVFTWEPGDILLTGTPGAVVLSSGNTICCEIDSVGSVENPVVNLPRNHASHFQNGEK
jgi:2-keto-4-pentenoate hydratase/2-oxohepta-3-ene-1,7-dioic acid hydratase in catechol pathway